MLQTDILSYPATTMDKATIRSRSHGEDVSKLVEQSSDADLSEERRKSETDLAASQGLPAAKNTMNTNDLRYVEREVCFPAPVAIARDGCMTVAPLSVVPIPPHVITCMHARSKAVVRWIAS